MCLQPPTHPAARICLGLGAVLATIILLPIVVFPSSSSSGPSGPAWFPADHPLSPPALAARNIAAAHAALDLLANSTWADFAPPTTPADDDDDDDGNRNGGEPPPGRYANLTGFRAGDGLAWHDLGRFRERCGEARDAALRGTRGEEEDPVWRNVSGIVHGGWVRRAGAATRSWEDYNLTAVAPWLDWSLARSEWARNVTGSEGVMSVLLHSKDSILDWDDGRKTDDPPDTPAQRRPALPYRASLVRGVRADVTVEDADGGSGVWDMLMHGVHFPREGTIYLSTSSEKFDGIFGLPFLTPAHDYFLPSRELLGDAIADKTDGGGAALFADGALPWTSDLENPAGTTTPLPCCEFVLFAQVHPPKMPVVSRWGRHLPRVVDRIAEMEAELEDPVGVSVGNVPPLELSAVLWSPDCAFFLGSKGSEGSHDRDHLVGYKKEVQRWRVNRWLLVFAAIVYCQLRLLQLQIRESSTPSTMGRISFATVSVMVVVDGIVFAASSTWSLSAGFTLLPCLALVFTSFESTVVGGRFLYRIYEVQLPSSRPRRVANTAATVTTPDNATAAAVTTPPSPPVARDTDPLLPLPVTTRPNLPSTTPPIIIPSDQDIDAEIEAATTTTIPSPPQQQPPRAFQSIIRTFILIGITLTFLALASTSWHPSLRNLYLNACALLYASLWLPQILRNVARNSRRSLAWRFVAGHSLLRFAPLAYFWLRDDNLVFARPDRPAFILLVGWLGLQLAVLAVQDVLGPRFALPDAWTPPAWDYHRLLREDALEAGGLPLSLVGTGSEPPSPIRTRGTTTAAANKRNDDDHDGNTPAKLRIRSVDCAICTDRLDVAIVRAGEVDDSGVAGVLARRAYMVTPCRHIFHSHCLEGWMRYKLQCPICREDLPSL